MSPSNQEKSYAQRQTKTKATPEAEAATEAWLLSVSIYPEGSRAGLDHRCEVCGSVNPAGLILHNEQALCMVCWDTDQELEGERGSVSRGGAGNG